MLKDMMTRFELYRPTALDDAFDLIDEYGSGAWLMAGAGTRPQQRGRLIGKQKRGRAWSLVVSRHDIISACSVSPAIS